MILEKPAACGGRPSVSQCDDFCCDVFHKTPVVLDENHGRRALPEQRFQLHAGDHIDEVERLIPDKQMRLFAQAFCDQNLFLLALGKILDALVKLRALEFELAQNRFEQAFVDAVRLRKFVSH